MQALVVSFLAAFSLGLAFLPLVDTVQVLNDEIDYRVGLLSRCMLLDETVHQCDLTCLLKQLQGVRSWLLATCVQVDIITFP